MTGQAAGLRLSARRIDGIFRALSHPTRRRVLRAAIGLSLLLHVAVIYVPFLQEAFSTVSLSAGDCLRCALVASSVLWLRELSKFVSRATSQDGHREPSEP